MHGPSIQLPTHDQTAMSADLSASAVVGQVHDAGAALVRTHRAAAAGSVCGAGEGGLPRHPGQRRAPLAGLAVHRHGGARRRCRRGDGPAGAAHRATMATARVLQQHLHNRKASQFGRSLTQLLAVWSQPPNAMTCGLNSPVAVAIALLCHDVKSCESVPQCSVGRDCLHEFGTIGRSCLGKGLPAAVVQALFEWLLYECSRTVCLAMAGNLFPSPWKALVHRCTPDTSVTTVTDAQRKCSNLT